MKTYNGLWEKFISEENFELAYKNSQKHKKNQRQIRSFNRNPKENLKAVRKLVIDGKFTTSPYRERKVFEPKERIIYKLPYTPDRIVQHAIMNILEPIFKNLLIENTFACVKGRGQLKSSMKCAEFVRKYDYCLKCDIRKFYPSINQHILSGKLHRIIKDERFMKIVDDVIFSYPGGKNCPIGNYMSQWCGNYYLSFMDNFILHRLKPGGYLRYCDDFMLFSNDKAFLHDCRRKIEQFLKDELELEFSKAYVFSVRQGVDFCGYRHFKKYVLIRKRTARRMIRRMAEVKKKLADGTYDLDKIMGQAASANGLMKHACSHNLRVATDFDNIWKDIKARKEKEKDEYRRIESCPGQHSKEGSRQQGDAQGDPGKDLRPDGTARAVTC